MNMKLMTGRWRRSTLVVKNMTRSTHTGANMFFVFSDYTQHNSVFFLVLKTSLQ